MNPQEGALRIYNITNIPNKPSHYPVQNPMHGALLIELLAESQLPDPTIESNVFGVQVFQNGEWEEWENEHGDTISEHAQEKKWETPVRQYAKGPIICTLADWQSLSEEQQKFLEEAQRGGLAYCINSDGPVAWGPAINSLFTVPIQTEKNHQDGWVIRPVKK